MITDMCLELDVDFVNAETLDVDESQDLSSDMDVDECDWHDLVGGRQDGRLASLGHQLPLPAGDQHHPLWLPHVFGNIS